MILVNKKKPISALKLIHTLNHTQTTRMCSIHTKHIDSIKTLTYTPGKRIYNLQAGLYKIIDNGVEYVIDIYFNLSNSDSVIINNVDDITIYMAGSTPYHVVPYRINSVYDILIPTIDSVNSTIDAIMISGNTKYSGTPDINNPAKINRTANAPIRTSSGSNSYSLNIPFKYTLGKLPNGATDYIIINSEQLIAHSIINTSKEILSGGLNWEYKEAYCNNDYYVFFAKYENVKSNNKADSIRCSHFEAVSRDDLIDKNTNKNCIATSYGLYGNGLWIKIAKSILDEDKDFEQKMKQWILSQAISENPIYIEYEISNTIYDTILIDEYHIKTWYPTTNVIIDDCDFSIFYKALKKL